MAFTAVGISPLRASAPAGINVTLLTSSILMAMFVVGVILVLIAAGRRCWMTLHGAPIQKQAVVPPVVDGQSRMAAVEV